MAKYCEICGKPSGMYPLCTACFKLRDEGKVEKCEKCGKWHYTNKPCDCKREEKAEIKTEIKEKSTNELTCIICGEPSNGLHFCKKCYAKYKDRSVDIRITNCNETKILDEYGNLKISCADGRKVRSRAEKIIGDWLFYNKIRAVYEKTVYYKDPETGKDDQLHPDFYLPDYDLFIEYNEITNKPYLAKKEYALNIYARLHKKVIIITNTDIDDIDACLKPILNIN